MSKREWIVAGGLMMMIVAAVVVPLLRNPPPKMPAGEAAYHAAVKKGLPVVLCFRFGVGAATRDAKCLTMGELTAKLRERYKGRVALIDVSLDPNTTERYLIEHYSIRNVPTTLLLSRSGKLLEVHDGVWAEEKLVAAVDKAAG
ncbi:MAG: hypothetical protein HYU66_11785 [Armatimonadetes bacterium]|nr:hypothetical protein [Armatimonadota bacterium]